MKVLKYLIYLSGGIYLAICLTTFDLDMSDLKLWIIWTPMMFWGCILRDMKP